MQKPARAFVLRIAPNDDRVEEAIESGDLIIGWSCAPGLLDANLSWEQFRKIVHEGCYSGEKDYRRSGAGAGNIWRFVREMQEGDLVVIPHGPHFYIAQVARPPRYDQDKAKDDTAYRRKTNLLNSGRPIPRKWARAALQSRLKARHTCADATDLVDAILEVLLEVAEKGRAPSFAEDLRRRLLDETQKEICSGRLNPDAFEELVAAVLRSLGAENVRIILKNLDKGADILPDFMIAKTFKLTLAVQAKHFQPDPPVGSEVIDQLVRGMVAEGAQFGWVATSGTFSPSAIAHAKELEEQMGFRIELVDGELLATLIIEGGLRVAVASEQGHDA